MAANLSLGIVMIEAVPQDGVSECWNDADEQPAAWYETYGIPGQCNRIQDLSMCEYVNLFFPLLFYKIYFQPHSLLHLRSRQDLLL